MFQPRHFALSAELAADSLLRRLHSSPSFFTSFRWDSDFAHDPNWSVVPLYLNPQWAVDHMHTFEHPLAFLGKGLFADALNSNAASKFKDAYAFLRDFIDTGLINYIGVSVLPSNTSLNPHLHPNPGNLKLHSAIHCPPGCGLLHSDGDHCYQHTWLTTNCSVFFDDNFIHSAWNHSDSTRYVLIFDFKSSLITSLEID